MTDRQLFVQAYIVVNELAWRRYLQAFELKWNDPNAALYTPQRLAWCLEDPDWAEVIFLIKVGGNW